MRILCGLDTEYGLLIEGRGANTQIEDSTALVKAYPGECFVGWNYRYESPRADLRGFKLKNLAIDPEDARFDAGKPIADPHEVRADRVLANGARLYNDHGHPEYATPECDSVRQLALHDLAGSEVVLAAARSYAQQSGRSVTIYKNNTDHQGASWGTHESYLAPRELGFERLFRDLLPLLVVRQVLCGAGKVGAEHGRKCAYQLSQRADFFAEPANAETLYRRPIFNTRDEPHADPRDWIRLHVITGESNMIANATARKAGLVKLALRLCIEGTAPIWKLKDSVSAIAQVSKDDTMQFEIELEGKSWTTAYEIFESYFAAAEATLDLEEDEKWTISTSRQLLQALTDRNPDGYRKSIDWAAKRHMLEMFMAEQSWDWNEPALKAYDLEYHNIDPEDGLHGAMEAMGEVEPNPEPSQYEPCLHTVNEGTRAWARSVAIQRFSAHLVDACWRTVTLKTTQGVVELDLRPEVQYPPELADTDSVESYIQVIRSIQ